MNYIKLKEKHQKEINEFPFGFAFSNEQFETMMNKFGLEKDDLKSIYSLGAGCYIKKSDSNAMEEMFTRQQKEKQEQIDKDKDGTGFIYQMFEYELANHEYCITHDLTETFEALNLTKEEVNKNKNLLKGLHKALQKYK